MWCLILGALGCITMRLRLLVDWASLISGQELDLSNVLRSVPEALRTASAETDMVLNHNAF